MKRRTEHFTYELVRSRRRSMSLKVELDGTITVRAPFRTPPETADWFVESHRDWIEVSSVPENRSLQCVRPTQKRNVLKEKNERKRVKRTMLLLRSSWAFPMDRSRSGSKRRAGGAAVQRET